MTNYWKLKRDITIVQGKTWTAIFRYKYKSCKGQTKVPVDLTGYTATFIIRECAEDSAALLVLTDISGVTLGGTDGTIEVNITADQAAALTAGTNVYELELQIGYTVIGFATGNVNTFAEINHD